MKKNAITRGQSEFFAQTSMILRWRTDLRWKREEELKTGRAKRSRWRMVTTRNAKRRVPGERSSTQSRDSLTTCLGGTKNSIRL